MSHEIWGWDGAVFLDRDGVINRDSEAYVKSVEEMVFVPGSLEAIGRLTGRGVPVVVVTNQSAVGRGMITEATLAGMHDYLKTEVGRVGGIFLTSSIVRTHRHRTASAVNPEPE